MLLDLLTLLAATTQPQALQALPEVRAAALFPLAGYDLPSNGRLVVLQDEVEVRDAAGDVVAQVPGDGIAGQLRVLDLALPAGARLDLTASCAPCASDRTFSWPVRAEADTAAPAYADEEVRFSVGVDTNWPRHFGVQICLPPIVDAEPALHFPVANVGEVDPVRMDEVVHDCVVQDGRGQEPGVAFYAVVRGEHEGADFCVTSTVADVAGNTSALAEACTRLESDEEFAGCAQTGQGSIAALAALAAFLRRRRGARRRRDGPPQARSHRRMSTSKRIGSPVAVAAAVIGFTGGARADCFVAEPVKGLCLSDVRFLLDAEVDAIADDGNASLRVVEVFGEVTAARDGGTGAEPPADGAGVGLSQTPIAGELVSTTTPCAERDFDQGDRVLLVFVDGACVRGVILDDDGVVESAKPDAITATEAANASLSGRCDGALEEAGYTPRRCDTGPPWSCAGGIALPELFLLTALRRRRRDAEPAALLRMP